MHGILLIDKPEGITSHDVVRQIRRIYSTRKVGHAGTLDPLATGVLVVAVGDGTKILQFLFCDDKRYRASLQLGVTTDTYDAQGQVQLILNVPVLTDAHLEMACDEFRGTFSQLPPMYSALKRNGIPLYKLARQGETVDREERQITVSKLRIVHFQPPELILEVDCSKGTYIRSLASDLGERLGCGAHLKALRRLRSGRFSIDHCYTFDQLQQLEDPAQALLSLPEALAGYPVVQLDASGLKNLAFGIPPELVQCQSADVLDDGGLVRLQQADRLLAVARYRPLRIKEKRGDFELIRVFLLPS